MNSYIPIFISIVSLLITITTFYITHVRKVNRLLFVRPTALPLRENDNPKFFLHNNGNLGITIISMSCYYHSIPNSHNLYISAKTLITPELKKHIEPKKGISIELCIETYPPVYNPEYAIDDEQSMHLIFCIEWINDSGVRFIRHIALDHMVIINIENRRRYILTPFFNDSVELYTLKKQYHPKPNKNLVWDAIAPHK